jgi:hypothetical protein
MEYPNFIKQKNYNAGTFSLVYLCAKRDKPVKPVSVHSRVRTFVGWYYNMCYPKAFVGSGIMGFYTAMRK